MNPLLELDDLLRRDLLLFERDELEQRLEDIPEMSFNMKGAVLSVCVATGFASAAVGSFLLIALIAALSGHQDWTFVGWATVTFVALAAICAVTNAVTNKAESWDEERTFTRAEIAKINKEVAR